MPAATTTTRSRRRRTVQRRARARTQFEAGINGSEPTAGLVLAPAEGDATIWVERTEADPDEDVFEHGTTKLRKTQLAPYLRTRRRQALGRGPKKPTSQQRKARDLRSREMKRLGRKPTPLTPEEAKLRVWVDYPRLSSHPTKVLYPVQIGTHIGRLRRLEILRRLSVT